MISALNTCLVIHQRKAKVLRESGLKSKQSQELYIRLLLHFAGTKFISRVDYFSFFLQNQSLSGVHAIALELSIVLW